MPFAPLAASIASCTPLWVPITRKPPTSAVASPRRSTFISSTSVGRRARAAGRDRIGELARRVVVAGLEQLDLLARAAGGGDDRQRRLAAEPGLDVALEVGRGAVRPRQLGQRQGDRLFRDPGDALEDLGGLLVLLGVGVDVQVQRRQARPRKRGGSRRRRGGTCRRPAPRREAPAPRATRRGPAPRRRPPPARGAAGPRSRARTRTAEIPAGPPPEPARPRARPRRRRPRPRTARPSAARDRCEPRRPQERPACPPPSAQQAELRWLQAGRSRVAADEAGVGRGSRGRGNRTGDPYTVSTATSSLVRAGLRRRRPSGGRSRSPGGCPGARRPRGGGSRGGMPNRA